ncbi:unnamed protein product [Menidia menidia]|uniref:(Atlantic silverside) hypothetical protein n=1 Tax=Menidia menidia TaxID=238744 RepID=A0A8S4ABD9_9TELE|nr:unnamed protein product [Menidia menidia]
MEKVLCTVHDTLCMLKTGVKDGPTKGKSFYVCVDKQSCDFSQQASVSPSHCLHHEDSMVELQALSYSQQQQSHRLYYRCVVGKKAGQRWCGNVPWTAPGIEKRSPLSDAQLQPSCLPPVRNPFKVPSKADKTQAGGEENGSQTGHNKAEGKEKRQKENAVDAGAKAEEEVEGKMKESDTYRGKQLPPGMKVKKRVSSEEKADQVGEITDKIKDLTKKEQKEAGEHKMDRPQFDKVKKTSLDLDKTTKQRPNEDKTRPVTQPDESSVRNKSVSSPPGVPSLDPPDDDVVLVSVKPAPRRTPPPSAVQKTLTSFPGFQAGDPRGMRGLLSAQLQQKKATLSAVNVAALPDKGERLRTQVRELEDALNSLSLGAHPESPQGSNGGVPGPSKLNPS